MLVGLGMAISFGLGGFVKVRETPVYRDVFGQAILPITVEEICTELQRIPNFRFFNVTTTVRPRLMLRIAVSDPEKLADEILSTPLTLIARKALHLILETELECDPREAWHLALQARPALPERTLSQAKQKEEV